MEQLKQLEQLITDHKIPIGQWSKAIIGWLTDNFEWLFDAISSVLKAGMLFKKMDATPTEKTAIDSTTVDSDSNKLVVRFKADDKSFQQLIESPMFASVVR